MSSYHPLPQPDEVPIKDREDAMGSYLMMFAAIGAGLPLPIINLIASIIYFNIYKKGSRFVRFHCHQALFSQLPVTLMNGCGAAWTLRIIIYDEIHTDNIYWGYLGMLLVVNIFYIIFGIVAAVQARKGRMYYYWLFGKIAYQAVFLVKEGDGESETKKTVNLPPRM